MGTILGEAYGHLQVTEIARGRALGRFGVSTATSWRSTPLCAAPLTATVAEPCTQPNADLRVSCRFPTPWSLIPAVENLTTKWYGRYAISGSVHADPPPCRCNHACDLVHVSNPRRAPQFVVQNVCYWLHERTTADSIPTTGRKAKGKPSSFLLSGGSQKWWETPPHHEPQERVIGNNGPWGLV